MSMAVPAPVELEVDAPELVTNWRPLVQWFLAIPHYIALYRAGRLPVDRLVTHRIKLDEINLGFDRLANGEAIRQVIVF